MGEEAISLYLVLLFSGDDFAQALHEVLALVLLQCLLLEIGPEVFIFGLVVNANDYPPEHLVGLGLLILDIYLLQALDVKLVGQLDPVDAVGLELAVQVPDLLLDLLLVVVAVDFLLVVGHLAVQFSDLGVELGYL